MKTLPTGWRLGLFYGLLFLGTGASLPYLPVWLKAQGLSGSAIGAVLAAPLLARIATGQLAARWADSFQQRRTALMLLAAMAAAAYAALLLTDNPLGHAAAWFVGSTAAMALIPLTDVLTLRLSRREGFLYGRPRAVGSAAFIVANLALGALLTRGSPDRVVIWMIAAAAATAACVRLLLPPEPVHEPGDQRRDRARIGVRALLKDRMFVLVIVSAGLIQAAHAFHYGFSALVWTRQGLSEAVIGALWATGVAAEIVFLWFFERWRHRLGPERLLLLGGGASVLRWTISALAPPVVVLFPLQALHALTFAASFLGALQLVHRLAPPESASAAQTLSSSLSGGLLIGLATLAGGALYQAFGAAGYLAMAAMAALGLVGALRLRPAPAATA
jgi:PPP family 3-phenylpropionic acid transporter